MTLFVLFWLESSFFLVKFGRYLEIEANEKGKYAGQREAAQKIKRINVNRSGRTSPRRNTHLGLDWDQAPCLGRSVDAGGKDGCCESGWGTMENLGLHTCVCICALACDLGKDVSSVQRAQMLVVRYRYAVLLSLGLFVLQSTSAHDHCCPWGVRRAPQTHYQVHHDPYDPHAACSPHGPQACSNSATSSATGLSPWVAETQTRIPPCNHMDSLFLCTECLTFNSSCEKTKNWEVSLPRGHGQPPTWREVPLANTQHA